MAIGKRIKFFRNKKGMTQKQFGEMLGFLGKTSSGMRGFRRRRLQRQLRF